MSVIPKRYVEEIYSDKNGYEPGKIYSDDNGYEPGKIDSDKNRYGKKTIKAPKKDLSGIMRERFKPREEFPVRYAGQGQRNNKPDNNSNTVIAHVRIDGKNVQYERPQGLSREEKKFHEKCAIGDYREITYYESRG